MDFTEESKIDKYFLKIFSYQNNPQKNRVRKKEINIWKKKKKEKQTIKNAKLNGV